MRIIEYTVHICKFKKQNHLCERPAEVLSRGNLFLTICLVIMTRLYNVNSDKLDKNL